MAKPLCTRVFIWAGHIILLHLYTSTTFFSLSYPVGQLPSPCILIWSPSCLSSSLCLSPTSVSLFSVYHFPWFYPTLSFSFLLQPSILFLPNIFTVFLFLSFHTVPSASPFLVYCGVTVSFTVPSGDRVWAVVEAQELGQADGEGTRLLQKNARLGHRRQRRLPPQVSHSQKRWVLRSTAGSGLLNIITVRDTKYSILVGGCERLFSATRGH